MVMYLGTVVEYADCDELFEYRLHPYTKALLDAVPIPVLGAKKERQLLTGEISSPIDPKPGCRFAGRCPYAKDICFKRNSAAYHLPSGTSGSLPLCKKEINHI